MYQYVRTFVHTSAPATPARCTPAVPNTTNRLAALRKTNNTPALTALPTLITMDRVLALVSYQSCQFTGPININYIKIMRGSIQFRSNISQIRTVQYRFKNNTISIHQELASAAVPPSLPHHHPVTPTTTITAPPLSTRARIPTKSPKPNATSHATTLVRKA